MWERIFTKLFDQIKDLIPLQWSVLRTFLDQKQHAKSPGAIVGEQFAANAVCPQ